MFASKAFYILQTPAARRVGERLYTRATNDRHVTGTPIGCAGVKGEKGSGSEDIEKQEGIHNGADEREGVKNARKDETDSFCLCQTRQATKGMVVESASSEF